MPYKNARRQRQTLRRWNYSEAGLKSKIKYWISLIEYERKQGNQIPRRWEWKAAHYEQMLERLLDRHRKYLPQERADHA